VNQTLISLTNDACLPLTGTPCKICVDAEQIQFTGDKLQGCPILRTDCNGITIARQPAACTTLATSSSSCANPDQDAAGSGNTPNLLLVILVVVLGIGILGVGAYFGYEKYKESQARLVFQRVPSATDDDDLDEPTTPLGSPVDEEDESS